MCNKTQNVIEDLMDRVPELVPLFHEHLQDNDTLLPHVFMGDVSRFVLELCERPTAERLEILSRIVSYLEDAWKAGCDEERNLIDVSFLENVANEGSASAFLCTRLGPVLRSELVKWK